MILFSIYLDYNLLFTGDDRLVKNLFNKYKMKNSQTLICLRQLNN